MKHFLLIAFLVGDLVHFINPTILTAGVWRIVKVHDGVYDMYDDKNPCLMKDVPEKFLQKYNGE